MPISRLRKKQKNKKKGPTPKSEGMSVTQMHRMLDILDEAEQEYYAKQNDEENKDGSE